MGGRLAPCPICGGNATNEWNAVDDAAYVQCLGCGAASGYYLDTDAAVHAWNTRTKPLNPKLTWLHAQCGDCGYLIATRDGVGRICRRSNNTFNQAGVLDNDPACPDFRRRV